MLPEGKSPCGLQVAFNPKANQYGLHKPHFCAAPSTAKNGVEEDGTECQNENDQNRNHHHSWQGSHWALAIPATREEEKEEEEEE